MSSFINELKRRNVFRVAAAYVVGSWFILQLSDAVLGNIGTPEWVFKAVLWFLVIGFPVALLFAWAFELTAEGVKREKDVDRSASITRHTGKRLERFTIVLLSLVILIFVAREFMPDGPAPETKVAALPSSIAVLPFEDFSENADQSYFSRGISEEILNLLAKTQGLRVAARTSSFTFAGGTADIREIGEKLGVETVLEGSVRKAGNTVRITAQLINVADGYHLWSETYDRDYSDIFKVQDEIATAILDALRVELLGEQQQDVVVVQTTKDLDAYSAYLIGKERFALRTRKDLEEARTKFEESIAIDPDYAPAHEALAHTWLVLERREFADLDAAEVDAVIGPHINTALQLAPQSPEALAVRGLQHLQRHRYTEARADLDLAIELNPNYAPAYLWRSETHYQQEQYLAMLADKEKAYALDPMSLEIASQLAYDYGAFWRPADADRIIARMFELHPGHPTAYRTLAANLGSHGRYAEAALLLEEAMEKNPDVEQFREWHAYLLVVMGLFEQALDENQDLATFEVLLEQGRIEKARELLEQHLADKPDLDWLFASRWFYRTQLPELGIAPLRSAVAQELDFLASENIDWREQCYPYLMYDMRETGIDDDLPAMMEECRKHTEERVKAQFLCPCSWYSLVLFATLDGRPDDAIQRAREWLDKGDSYSLLHNDPILKEWADRPEYQEILSRNAEQVQRQQALYLAGAAARDAPPAPATGGASGG